MWRNFSKTYNENGTTDASVQEIKSNNSNMSQEMIFIYSGVGALTLVVCVSLCLVAFLRKRRNPKLLEVKTIPKVASSPGLARLVARHSIQFVLPYISSGEMSQDERSDNNNEETQLKSSISRSSSFKNSVKKTHTLEWYTISPNTIERDLYISSEGDDGSCRPSANGLGRIGFSIFYSYKCNELRVKIIAASCLAERHRRQVNCPHVKVTLFPDKSQKFFTKVQRNNPNPVYNEEFVCSIQWPPEDASSSSNPEEDSSVEKGLKITVCDFDRFSRRFVIGHVYQRLALCGITSSCSQDVNTGEIWKDLTDDVSPSQVQKGEVFLSLCYNPDSATLTLGVEKVRNIQAPRSERDVVAVYIKVTLFDKGKVVKSKKTEARKKSNEIVFEESFDIKIPRHSLKDVHCVVSACARNRLGSRQVIGRSMLGSQSHVTGHGLDHWADAMNSFRSTVGQWHALM